MFESLKAKMKSLFSRAEKKIDEKAVYKEGPDAPQVEPPKVETPEVPKVETPKVEVPEVRTEVPKVETPEVPEVKTSTVEPVKPVEPPKVEVPRSPRLPHPRSRPLPSLPRSSPGRSNSSWRSRRSPEERHPSSSTTTS